DRIWTQRARIRDKSRKGKLWQSQLAYPTAWKVNCIELTWNTDNFFNFFWSLDTRTTAPYSIRGRKWRWNERCLRSVRGANIVVARPWGRVGVWSIFRSPISTAEL